MTLTLLSLCTRGVSPVQLPPRSTACLIQRARSPALLRRLSSLPCPRRPSPRASSWTHSQSGRESGSQQSEACVDADDESAHHRLAIGPSEASAREGARAKALCPCRLSLHWPPTPQTRSFPPQHLHPQPSTLNTPCSSTPRRAAAQRKRGREEMHRCAEEGR
jgi:hypothetical protein